MSSDGKCLYCSNVLMSLNLSLINNHFIFIITKLIKSQIKLNIFKAFLKQTTSLESELKKKDELKLENSSKS